MYLYRPSETDTDYRSPDVSLFGLLGYLIQKLAKHLKIISYIRKIYSKNIRIFSTPKSLSHILISFN